MAAVTADTNSTSGWWGSSSERRAIPPHGNCTAWARLRGERESGRYTRTLVSRTAATRMAFLARPAPLAARCTRLIAITLGLKSGRLSKTPPTLPAGEFRRARARGHDGDEQAARDRLNLVADLKVIDIDQPLGQRDLEVAGDTPHEVSVGA